MFLIFSRRRTFIYGCTRDSLSLIRFHNEFHNARNDKSFQTKYHVYMTLKRSLSSMTIFVSEINAINIICKTYGEDFTQCMFLLLNIAHL